jgi:hypothetical protein
MIDLSTFKGAIPKISDRLLPDGHASDAKNCDLSGGNLKPIKGVSSVQDVAADIQTIFKMNSSFLVWDEVVNAVRSLIADSGNRILFTGDGYPKETNAALALTSSPYPTATRRLGIPAPTNALTVTLNGTAGETMVHSSSYVYTLVGKWADGSEVESAPSPPTGVFEVYSGIIPELTGFEDATATGAYTTHFRIYRLNSGNVGSEYRYVDEMAVTETSYDDEKTDDDIVNNGEIKTVGMTAPDDSLEGLIPTSHGLVFGFKGNTVYPSEVFMTYAYPAEYSLPAESDIVGLGFTGSLVLALTKTVPYLILGQDPATMQMKRLGYQQPCVSARSIIGFPGGVIYASPDGLFRIDEAGVGLLITENIFKKSQWTDLTPANLIGVYYDSSYFGVFAGTTTGFRLDLVTGEYQGIEFAAAVHGLHYSPEDDTLYLVQTKGAAREIVSWDTGAVADYTWESKEFSSPSQAVHTAGMVQGDFTSGNTTLTFYVDGALAHTQVMSTDGLFRVPVKRGNIFQAKLAGKGTIHRLLIGESVAEIVREMANV